MTVYLCGAVTLRNFAVQARYQRTIVSTPDGGTFGLDWFCCREACESLPDRAPVLLVLHSITGHPDVLCTGQSSLTIKGLSCLLQLHIQVLYLSV